MCTPIQGFKLCTCTEESIVHNKKAKLRNTRRKERKENLPPPYMWDLQRYRGDSGLSIIGIMALPSDDIGSGLTEENVLKQLNAENCFDFDYTPQQQDRVTIYRKGSREKFLAFSFIDGKWATDPFFDTFNDVMEDIRNGTLKPINETPDTFSANL